MLFLFPRFATQSRKHLEKDMYPKVKVREQIEEADQYDYERSSLQSLKAFEWLSLDYFSSSDERLRPVVRIPGSYFPKLPTLGFRASKEETNEEKRAVVCGKKKNVRAASAPRPRAILSSPDNDSITGSKAQTRKELLSALRNHNSCHRHTKCKAFPSSEGAEIVPPQRRQKEATESKNNIRAKGRTTVADSSVEQDVGKGSSQHSPRAKLLRRSRKPNLVHNMLPILQEDENTVLRTKMHC